MSLDFTELLGEFTFLGSVCGICGESHECSKCTFVNIQKHICDNIIPSKARLTLPDLFHLETMSDGSYSIMAKVLIKKGTKFGPLEAPKLFTLNPNIVFPLKIFNSSIEDLSEYYLDTCDENNCNWMIFIASAQTVEEQNLICFQDASEIFYATLRDIKMGEFLKVWYSPYYAKQMKQDLLIDENLSDNCDNNNTPALEPINLNMLVKKQEKLMGRENWTCRFCGKVGTDIPVYASHLLEEHYGKKVSLKYCNFCEESFTTQKKLKKHVRKAHKKVLNKLPTESSIDKNVNEDPLVGGPLLDVLLNNSFNNTNLLMPIAELNEISETLDNTLDNQNLLLENDSLNLNVDNILTENVKDLDHFNFEIGESQEQYVCDVCLKSFSKLQYLTQHLRKHTGRYTCKYCLKVFCRRENLDSHNCTKMKTPQFECDICGRSFMIRKYLVRHVNNVHIRKHSCENCNKQYHSNKEYLEHNCSAVPDGLKTTFSCVICNKNFDREIYLKRHQKIHERYKQKSNPKGDCFMCEICAQTFNSKKGLSAHKLIHSEPRLECEICNKKFHRQDVLNVHKETHCDTQVFCPVCHGIFKNKRCLSSHMIQHTGIKSHKCDFCSKAFSQYSSLALHNKKVHSNTCDKCNKVFPSKDLFIRHNRKYHLLREFYECPVCCKVVKLKSSLKKHLKSYHPEEKLSEIMLTVKSTVNYNNIYDDIDGEVTDGGNNTVDDNISADNNNAVINDNMPISMNFLKEENNLDILIEPELVPHNSYIDSETNNQENNTDIHNVENITSESKQDNLETIVSDFEEMINSYNSNGANNALIEDSNKMGEHISQELDFNALGIDLDSDFVLQQNQSVNEVVNLSMPDLMETDENIRLSENSYMLDNGDVVEPNGGPGNIILYIVDKQQ